MGVALDVHGVTGLRDWMLRMGAMGSATELQALLKSSRNNGLDVTGRGGPALAAKLAGVTCARVESLLDEPACQQVMAGNVCVDE